MSTFALSCNVRASWSGVVCLGHFIHQYSHSTTIYWVPHGPHSVLNVENVAGNNTGQASICTLSQVVMRVMRKLKTVERDKSPGWWGRKGCSFIHKVRDSLSAKVVFAQTWVKLGWRIFQNEKTRSTKSLRQENAWCVWGAVKKSVRPEQDKV